MPRISAYGHLFTHPGPPVVARRVRYLLRCIVITDLSREYIARLSTRQLVHVLAPVLLARGKELGNASKQSKRLVRSVEILKFDLCDSLTSLLKLKEGELNYQILADGGEPDLEPHFIILVSSEGDGEIIPTSPEARNTSALAVTSSRDLRSIVQGVDPMANLISMNPLLTPSVMQLLQLELDSGDYPRPDYRRRCIQILQKLSRTHHVLPPSLFLRNVALDSVSATTGGGFADIWKGLLGEQPVCLKVLRMFLDSDAKMRKKVLHAFCNEALVWRQLDHPNILPLLGVNVSLFAPSFCLISPWMHNGDINRYMRVTPNFDKLKALTEIAAGLRYLHGLIPPVVHGDLRGANILVSSDGADLPRCCLADFGLALVAETQTLTSTTEMRGASRWMAPELIDPSAYEDFDSKRNRLPADIYAFACTVIEVRFYQINSKWL
ncbi:hypothetical protein GYMLUDRAFT_1005780 [Collybiopsis luxurians FD-317 M1]|uniref:Protein kinase domain-containing protein n=1 Tax=Collybiopsis luxurians FD-317 M1 TaxID=944289 RepID=A0A0D0CSB0_9AGAR|nr:hypothetical protein GYMLUDRAFT_1005780 [Collybiopsis luxurians FD-317 M1]